MPEPILYEQVYDLLYQTLDKKINQYTLERLTLLVLGIIRSRSASPAGIARAPDSILDIVSQLLPVSIPVIWLADRAFGSPSFIDLIAERGWHYIVRLVSITILTLQFQTCPPLNP